MTLEVEHFGGTDRARPLLVGWSTCNPLGVTPHQTWAFRRAELTAFVGSPFRLPSGNPLGFARVRQLDPLVYGTERLVTLARRAFAGVEPALQRLPAEASLAITLCLPRRLERPAGSDGRSARRALERECIGRLVEQGRAVQPHVVALDHAGFGYALMQVAPRLARGELDAALVVSVDSYYDPDVLERLFAEERVIDSDWREGFVPGEAASALLFVRPAVARGVGLAPLASVDAVATAEEIATLDNSVGLLGLGLSRPATALARRLKDQGRTLDWWISDATGETLRIQELQLAWPRAAHLAMTPDGVLSLLPTHLGDLGAATMGTALTLGVEGLRRGDPVGSTCLCSGSSLDGERATVLVTAEAP